MSIDLEIWKIVSTAFIGVAGVILAIVQVKIKKKEFKSALFDKRIEIYDAFIALSLQCGLQAPTPNKNVFEDIFKKYQRYKFFFNGEIKEKLRSLEIEFIVSWHLWNSAQSGTPEEITKNKENIVKLMGAVQEQLEKEIGIFTPEICE